MSGITLDQAQAQLDAYLAAEARLLTTAQSATLPNGNTVTLADLSSIQAGIKRWESKVNELSSRASGRSRCRTVGARW